MLPSYRSCCYLQFQFFTPVSWNILSTTGIPGIPQAGWSFRELLSKTIKKLGRLSRQPARLFALEEPRGFPPPSHGGFGFFCDVPTISIMPDFCQSFHINKVKYFHKNFLYRPVKSGWRSHPITLSSRPIHQLEFLRKIQE